MVEMYLFRFTYSFDLVLYVCVAASEIVHFYGCVVSFKRRTFYFIYKGLLFNGITIMNRQIFKQKELIKYALRIAINKAKLILTEEKLINLINDEHLKEKLKINFDEEVCIDEIEHEELPRIILSSLGCISKSLDAFSLINTLKNKYDDFDDFQCEILSNFVKCITEIAKSVPNTGWGNFLESIFNNYKIEYFVFAIDVIRAFNDYYYSSPVNRSSKYGDIQPIKLSELFTLEKNNSQIGEFFDQRYIDYLSANFKDLNKINWRKFEELSAQFFRNDGYDITLGKGRKDDGVDIVAKKGTQIIIIQCKKWKNKVGVSEIKTFHDDIIHGKYSLGILVCANDITSDSKKLIDERKYEIQIMNKEYIFQKLDEYKSFT